jgi:hypothetical protein
MTRGTTVYLSIRWQCNLFEKRDERRWGMLHAQRLLIYSAPLKVVAIHRPILLLASPSNAVAQARAGQGARGVHASTPDSRDKRRRSHFQREYTEPKEEEPNKMEGDAISSVYILLYAATITTLSLSVCIQCVCVYTWWKTEHVPPENRGGLYNTTGRPIGRIHGSLYKDKPAWWWVPPGLDCILMSSLFLVPSLYYILLPPTTLKSRRKMCNMSTHTHRSL